MKVCDERFDSLFFSSSRDQTRENGHRPLTRMKHQLVDHRTSIHPGAPGLRAQQSQWDRAVSHLYTIWKGAEGGLFFLTSFFFFLAALGLHCCVRAFPSHSEWGLLCVVVCRLLIAVASLPRRTGPRACGLSSCSSQALECRLPQ